MPKVLIVEDDNLISRMYQQAFEFEKFEVKVAFNGQEGWEMLTKFKPDLILMDVMMPEMNGLDLLRKIKDRDEYKKIPVIMLTNLSGSKDVEVALGLGAVKFIVKSQLKPRQVVAEVKTILAAYVRGEIPD